MNAVTGEKIEDAAAVGGEKLGAEASFVLDVHFEQVEKPCPLRVYVGDIKRRSGANHSCRHEIRSMSRGQNSSLFEHEEHRVQTLCDGPMRGTTRRVACVQRTQVWVARILNREWARFEGLQ